MTQTSLNSNQESKALRQLYRSRVVINGGHGRTCEAVHFRIGNLLREKLFLEEVKGELPKDMSYAVEQG